MKKQTQTSKAVVKTDKAPNIGTTKMQGVTRRLTKSERNQQKKLQTKTK